MQTPTFTINERENTTGHHSGDRYISGTLPDGRRISVSLYIDNRSGGWYGYGAAALWDSTGTERLDSMACDEPSDFGARTIAGAVKYRTRCRARVTRWLAERGVRLPGRIRCVSNGREAALACPDAHG